MVAWCRLVQAGGMDPMRRLPPLLDAVAVHLVRFLVMAVVVGGATLLGISSWFVGLAANVAVTVLAVVLVTVRGLWSRTGLTRLWRSPWALLALLPLVAEALSWAFRGSEIGPPGAGWWALTLLLTGVNEELISRGVVLDRLESAFAPLPAVSLTAVLFGLQHLSALALTGRGPVDVLQNVALSACYGFALAAFQLTFRWLWPLVLVHALADWTTLAALTYPSDAVVVAIHAGLLVYGLILLWLGSRRGLGVPAEPTLTGPGPSRGRLPGPPHAVEGCRRWDLRGRPSGRGHRAVVC